MSNNLDEYLKKKEEPKPEPIQHALAPEVKADEEKKKKTMLTKEDREKMLNKVFGSKKMSRREKKQVLSLESEGTKNRQWYVFGFTIIGLMFIFMLYQYLQIEWAIVVLIYVGCFMFLPAGMILGWAFLDPYMRCKMIRKVTKKNYGLIYFVGKGQKIATKTKNFDSGMVWKKNEVWIITNEFIYQITKDGDKIIDENTKVIEPENFITLIDTVPVMFVDIDSMQPLSLSRDRREGINPLELGATLKAWADNERAKAMMFGKKMDMMFIICIIASMAAAAISYMTLSQMGNLTDQVKALNGLVQQLIAQLATTPPTT